MKVEGWPGEVAEEMVRAHLERILHSPRFKASEKQKRFLKFIVEETLQGRATQIKAYTVAIAVYDRPASFDPQENPIVRVEAGRLRRALENYYLTSDTVSPVRIEIPKGRYVPLFIDTLRSVSGDARQQGASGRESFFPGPSIILLPLKNLSGDEERDYFADGLTEELISELARFQDISVIAAHSAKQLKNQQGDPQKIGRELGVRFLLAGSIRVGMTEIKITIQLFDTLTAEQIWGSTYKENLAAADLIAMQESIAQRVVGSIADHYGLMNRRLSKESRKKRPSELKTYDAVLRFYHYETVLTRESFLQARNALEEAVRLDPDYGLAWAMLGHLHADNFALGFVESTDSLDTALTCAQKGAALDKDNQFVQDAITLVHFHRGDRELFLKSVDETVALNPNAPYIVGVAGWHLCLFGEWERGGDLLAKGMALNPYHPTWFHLATFTDYYRRDDYENALAEALKFNYPDLFYDPLMRAAALSRMGRVKAAQKAVEQLLALVPDFSSKAREMIGTYVKVPDLIDKIIEGLIPAGLSITD
jgi:adenylate cyclase